MLLDSGFLPGLCPGFRIVGMNPIYIVMKSLIFVLVFLMSIHACASEVLVYNCRWLSPIQAAHIISPLTGANSFLKPIETTNQLVISDSAENIALIKSKLEEIDVTGQNELFLDQILASYTLVLGTLEVNANPVLRIRKNVRLGDSARSENMEKVLYRMGKTRDEDRYMTCGNDLKIKPEVEAGSVYLRIEYTYQFIAGWDAEGDPIPYSRTVQKRFKVNNGGKSDLSIMKENDRDVSLSVLVRHDEYIGAR